MVRNRIPTDILKLLLDSNRIALIKVEARNAIVGSLDLPHYGIFGTCYSQPKDFVDKLFDQNSVKFYNTDTTYHELGQCTVDIVLSALNALPSIKAWQTPDNSVVDVCWKWDLIIEHNGCLYPA